MTAVWNDALVNLFCELCIVEVDNDNRPNSHFNKDGWANLVRNFSREAKAPYTKRQLKNKWDTLKEQWKLWKELKGKETGLGWDSNLNTVAASDEWWQGKVKINPAYAKLRKRGIPPELEFKMDKMFTGITATGTHAWAPSSKLPLPRSPKGYSDEETFEVTGDSDDSTDTTETVQMKKRKCDVKIDGKGKEATTRKGKEKGAAKTI